jgi:protein ImuB
MYACIHAPNLTEQNAADLIDVAKSFSPLIEIADRNTVVLPVDALRRYIGPPHQIASEIARRAAERNLTGNIGIAHTIDTAILAARNLPGVTIIPKGAEAKYIGEFRIETLPIDPETYSVLDRWGIRTLADFSALPDNEVSERLGAAAVHLQQLSRGAADRPLKLAPLGTDYQERFELEHEVTLIEPLLFILGRLLNTLCDRLLSHSMATTELHLCLNLANRSVHERTLQLPFATRDSKMMLKLLQLDLEARPPGAAVVAVTVSITPVQPRVIQNGLYTPVAPEPEKLELTLAKIRSMVGDDNAGSPQLLNTHRPGAWRMRPVASGQWSVASGRCSVVRAQRIAFRYFTPRLRARVDLTDGRPTRIFTQRMYGHVLEAAGPWRTSGDWWRNESWDRDDWDVALNDGGIYRLVVERRMEAWFVEGAYD